MKRAEILDILKEILLGEEGLVLAESVADMSEETSLIDDLVMDSTNFKFNRFNRK